MRLPTAALLALTLIPTLALAKPADDVAAIQKLEATFMAATNARDVDAIMKLYMPGTTLFVFDVGPPTAHIGWDDYKKDWQQTFAEMKGPIKGTIDDLQITVAGRLAYSHSLQRIAGTDMQGKPMDITFRVTDVYQKTKTGWLIVQEHVSVPFDFQTGKPVLAPTK
jgi:ketosteroid isomerase-like protein